MEDQQPKIVETVAGPNFILEGDFGELLAVRHYLKTPLTKKYLIVAYAEPGGKTERFCGEEAARGKPVIKIGEDRMLAGNFPDERLAQPS